jgi:carbon storage regulator
MLVLTRRIGEEIVIADNIRVTVAAICGKQVRIGITAPRSVPVARLELLAQGPDGLPPTLNGQPGKRRDRPAHRPNRHRDA